MTGSAMLKRWLTGWGYTEGLKEYVSQFPQAKYSGIVYRGLSFDHYPDLSEIKNQDFCSWTSDKLTAEYFAKQRKYGVILKKRSNGYCVSKILFSLKEKNECPESLLCYRQTNSEYEILDDLDMSKVSIRRVGVK